MMKYFIDKPVQWLHYSAVPGLAPFKQTEAFKKIFDHMFRIIQDDSAHWILDRSHLGETVYGTLYRPEENTGYVWYLEGKYRIAEKDNIGLIIFYDSSFENLKRDDGDSYTTDLEISKKEVELFKTAFNTTSIQNKLLIDIAGKNPDQVEKEVFDFLNINDLISWELLKEIRPDLCEDDIIII